MLRNRLAVYPGGVIKLGLIKLESINVIQVNRTLAFSHQTEVVRPNVYGPIKG